MTDTPKEDYKGVQEAIYGDDGYLENGQLSEADGEAIQELCDAFDSGKLERQKHLEKKKSFDPHRRKDRAYSSLWGWMYKLARMARDMRALDRLPDELGESTADDINDLMETGYYEKQAPSTTGMSKSTIRTYQFAARVFYRYHSEFGVDPEHIAVYESDSEPIKPKDMLTRDEINELSQAAESPRDLLIFQLLIYTGLRSNAARTLRIKDIDLDEGTYRLNDTADGLKGADERNGHRPLLFAEGIVRTYINQYHPQPDNPDAYLITHKESFTRRDCTSIVGHTTLSRALRKLKEKTGIDKPLHPHMCRHNFVTICKRDYGDKIDNDTIKYLIGHAKDSQVMETTYSHLDDSDFLDRARQAFGIEEAEEESTLTPKKCFCGSPVPPSAKACSNCGIRFTPDSIDAMETVDDAIHESKGEAETEAEETGVDVARDIIKNDPEAKAAIMEEMKDELLDELRDEMGNGNNTATSGR